MSGVNICWVVGEGLGSGVGGYQPLKALFLVAPENRTLSLYFMGIIL